MPNLELTETKRVTVHGEGLMKAVVSGRSLPPQLDTSQNVKNKLYIRSVYFCFILLGRNCRVKYCPAVHGLSHFGGIYPHHRNDTRVEGKGESVLSVFFLFFICIL
jgi:hypothetical protein